MMDVQLKEIVDFLEQQGYECTIVEKPKDSFIFIDVKVSEREMRLKCLFPNGFPYRFPKIYILTEFYQSIAPLPHINEKGYICTFDESISYPNYNKPKELVLCSLESAIKVIEDGLSGTNKNDFLDEFKAYWDLDTKYEVSSFITPKERPHKYPYCEYNGRLFIGENELQLKNYLQSVDGLKDNEVVKFKQCLHLPLNQEWFPPYPRTNKEVFLKVKDNPDCFTAYNNFLLDRTEPSIILFSHLINGNVCMGGWLHPSVKTPTGFRKGKIVPQVFYLGFGKDKEIIKFNVDQLNHGRIYFRGGDGFLLPKKKVSITGCGSIGSYMANSIVQLGINDLVLIDEEILTSENIARHYCGASDIGTFKANALKKSFINHYIDISCEAISENAFDIIDNKIDIFNECDFNFIVVGSRPLESRFIKLVNEGKINKTIVLIWVEPYLLGGHAVILQNPMEVENMLYNSEGYFKNNILIEGDKFSKKEAGCRSTFIPYSAFEIQQFVYSFMDYFNENFLKKSTPGNFIFSWAGKLDWAIRNSFKISDMWLAKSNRTYIVKRLNV